MIEAGTDFDTERLVPRRYEWAISAIGKFGLVVRNGLLIGGYGEKSRRPPDGAETCGEAFPANVFPNNSRI